MAKDLKKWRISQYVAKRFNYDSNEVDDRLIAKGLVISQRGSDTTWSEQSSFLRLITPKDLEYQIIH